MDTTYIEISVILAIRIQETADEAGSISFCVSFFLLEDRKWKLTVAVRSII
jgi:hypothetical protein